VPKRIPHLAETILDQAAKLFATQGYGPVDMKQVAAEAGTSVGNLYNYYPSKPDLFIAVIRRWKTEILEACRTLLASDLPRREKILALLGRLYDDVAQWRGLWMEFASGEGRARVLEKKTEHSQGHPWGLAPDEVELLRDFEQLLTGQPCREDVARWAYILVTATLQLAGRFPEDREKNWKFLETLVDKI